VATAVEAPESLDWEMPGQVFPPESFGPCAIEGERPTAVSKTRVEPASSRLFMSVLRDTEREFEPVDPGCDNPAIRSDRRSTAAGKSIPATPSRTAKRDFLFNDPQGHESICDESCVARCDGAGVSQLQPRIRLYWLPAHENFTRSTASNDSPGFSLIASRQPH
jgi:hypothetical protein